MSTTGQQGSGGGGLASGLRSILTALASFFVTGAVVSLFAGGPLVAGVFGGLDQAIFWGVLLAAVAYIGYFSDDMSIAFALTFVAVLLLLSTILPGWLTEPFGFISEGLFGTPDLGLDPVRFAVLAVAAVIVYWAVTIRLFGRGKRPGAVASQARQNAESLSRQYAKIARVTAGFLVAFVFIFSGAGGEFLGEVFGFVSGAPVVSGYAATLLGGFGTFVAGLPVLGSLTAIQFGFAALAVFALVVGMKYTDVLDN